VLPAAEPRAGRSAARTGAPCHMGRRWPSRGTGRR